MFCSQGKTSTFKLTSAKGPAQLGMGWRFKRKTRDFSTRPSQNVKRIFQIIEFSLKKKIITKYALRLKNVLETIKTDKRFGYQAAAFNK